MKKILSVLAIATLMLVGCSFSPREVSVKDVTKSEKIILKGNRNQGSITGIHITGRGSIDGKAELHLILNGAVYKKEAISGGVSFEWNGDWYADQAEVRYISDTVAGGTLKLKYKFR